MQRVRIPDIGETVELYVQFEGDDAYSGPFAAEVQRLDLVSRPKPLLDLFVPTLEATFCAVPHGAGTRAYWLS